MFQSLLRTLLHEQPRRVDATPGYQQGLDELPLRLLQQAGSDAPLLDLLPHLRDALNANALYLLLPVAGAPGWRQLGAPSAEGCPCGLAACEPTVPGTVRLCRGCLDQGRYRALGGLPPEDARPAWLLVDFSQRPGPWQRERMQDITRRLSEVLQAFGESRRLRRSELAAERAVLARELHDSVAQQLGYLQIRSSRLQALLVEHPHPAAGAMLDDLRESVRVMHRQVRELISNSRLGMDGRSLRQALEASVDEFARCSSCVFTLDNRLPANWLPAEGELQLLQIVREALANAVRHSHARQVWVRLWPVAGGATVEVRDDGVGLPEPLPEGGHFGLGIMRERAAAMGAQLTLQAAPGGGTCVRVHWGRP
ncbi:two-component system, NarL family, nitrate/nitrite sensor histidine kinase NarX [Pseudomonas cuatrocienegasensis]|uniref:histidine kinase n=1 Tax=Pseudomonas cuatrocienegasensis TaxID=543360 RepID=A0ABY1BD88_9PSED|nr:MULTISPECIES: ATP-binding protein [Pseudomonas]OEC33979.1 hypothetical protein A7D25_16395 [Pseudomonas sp. 21C1]SEQ58509.1 two-component system, NarL family, nitrate/nitrite sensor histidine kinase NarX [Pseudomonas cuatrocienegasensis]